MLVVLAGVAILTTDGFGGLPNLLIVLAGAAVLASSGFGGLPDLLVVLAGTTIVATGYVIINSRSVLSSWASFAGG